MALKCMGAPHRKHNDNTQMDYVCIKQSSIAYMNKYGATLCCAKYTLNHLHLHFTNSAPKYSKAPEWDVITGGHHWAAVIFA